MIVGNPLGARFPTADPSTRLAKFPDRSIAEIPQGAFPPQIIEETEEDLNEFVEVLEQAGVTVRRPEAWPHDAKFSTIHWESAGYYNYCPRDVLLVIADQMIETPNVMRSRYQETFSYRGLMMEYLKSGAKWYGAPKPMLLDSLFDVDLDKPTPRNDEPAFDAANVLRLGRDLIYLVSATGNEVGGQWIDMNLFSINPNLVVVDRDQSALIRLLEMKGLDVVPLKLRHSKMLGGGFHCVTLDVRRTGKLERYFD